MATLVGALVTALVYAWASMDPTRVEDLLFLGNASLYREPWRILTSTFIHRIAPHFAFNLFTLWWFGREVERRYGAGVFALTVFGALWTGQMFTLAVGMLPFHGISGAVCGLYGFLVTADWRNNLYQTIKQRLAYWLYPAALLALFAADRLGLTPVANLNHVVAIAYGALVGAAVTLQSHLRAWSTIAAATLTIAASFLGARSWEEPWQHLAMLPLLDCSVRRQPIGDVTKNGFVRIDVIDRSAQRKSISYIDSAGEKVPISRNNRRTYRLLPYIGSIWRIEDGDGRCRTQFEVRVPGAVTIQ